MAYRLAAWLFFVAFLLVHRVNSTCPGQPTTGPECIDDCVGRQDGRYQSCHGCTVYAICRNGQFKDNVPCDGKSIYWNQKEQRCTTGKPEQCNLHEVSSSAAGGVTYIRWGKKTCPATAEMVYTGYAAGSHYTNPGGGSNYLCLSNMPLWSHLSAKFKASIYRTHVFGAEYEEWGIFPQDHDVPCVVCETNGRASKVLMIPGRNRCFEGWTREYSGFLSAEYHGHKRIEFVCLDGAPDSIVGGHYNHNGALFYPVLAKCGSLSCPPYINNKELTCAVCTR